MSVHVPWRHHHHDHIDGKSLLDGLDLANPLHSGYMFKEAHSHLVFHKRFFVLFPKLLVYYEKESEYKKDVASGTLEHRHKAIVLKDLYLTKPEKKAKGAKFCFILHAPDKTNERCDFLLVTESKEQRKHWIEALQDLNPDLLESQHHAKHISPDTPQQMRRVNPSDSLEESPSSLNRSVSSQSGNGGPSRSISSESGGGGQANGALRPGSPRHDVLRVSSTEDMSRSSSTGSMDLLDIQHLNVREGPSDTEDN